MRNQKEGENLVGKIRKVSGEIEDWALARLMERRIQNTGGLLGSRVWYTAQRSFIFPYTEVAILNPNSSSILLDYRTDEFWNGWHIPGGRWQDPKLSVDQACNEVSKRELGVSVRFLKDVMFYKWNDHPYGYPLSLVCLCDSPDQVSESDTRRFFTEVPDDMVPHHGDFLQACFDYLKTPEINFSISR